MAPHVVSITDTEFRAVFHIRSFKNLKEKLEPVELAIRAYKVSGEIEDFQLVAETPDGDTGDVLLTDGMADGHYVWEKIVAIEVDDGDETDVEGGVSEQVLHMPRKINDEFLAWLDLQHEQGRFDIAHARFS